MIHIKFISLLLAFFFSFSLQDQAFTHLSGSPQAFRELESCPSGCLSCSSAEVCTTCDTNRALKNGRCLCESPRILRGSNCECPSYMEENPTSLECEYIDLFDVAYHSTLSPLFDTVFHAKMNPAMQFTIAPFVFWSADCGFRSADTESVFFEYLYGQITDRLTIPSSGLEFDLQCDLTATYTNGNGVDISKQIHFETLSSSQPQVHIVGGPFQTLKHSELNLVLIQVHSSSGTPISPFDAQVTWTQTSGEDQLTMSKLFSSSDPFRLTIPKCTLSPGNLYTFKVSVKVGTSTTSQEVTIAVHSPKISLGALDTDAYHIYTKNLKLTASAFTVEDECDQGISPADFLDSSTAMYSWECVIVDPYYSSRLLPTESTDIFNDPNVITHPDPQHLFYSSTTSKTITIPTSYFSDVPLEHWLIFYLTVTVKSNTPTPSIHLFNLYQPTFYALQTRAHVQILSSKPFTTVSLSCVSETNCEALIPDEFTTKFIASGYNPQYSDSWKFNAFIEGSSIGYQNYFTIISVSPSTSQNFVPQILLTVSNGANSASAFYTLPTNTAPTDGFVLFYPQDGGEAYKTNFFVTTTGWIDQDLPISFQWYTYTDSGGFNFMMPTFEPFTYTPIVQPPRPFPATVGVYITDNLKARMIMENYLAIPSSPKNWSQLLEQSHLALSSSRSSTNLFQRFRQISVIIENIQAWELTRFLEDDHSEEYSDASAELKYSALTEMKEVFLALNKKENLKPIFLRNLLYCTEQLWNQDRNWELYFAILDSYYQASSSTGILAEKTDRNNFATILNNLLTYLLKPGVSIQDPDEIFTAYINTLVRSMLENRIPSDEPVSYNKGFLLAHTRKVTYCEILQKEITQIPWGASSLRGNFTLKPGETLAPEQCNQQIDFIFLAFRPNYSTPGTNGIEYRTVIYMDLRDPITGESVIDLFNWFLFSPDSLCPLMLMFCNPDDEGTTIYGTFDLKNQIMKIFGKSNIELVKNFSALQDFKFWQSVAFWTVIGFSIWFIVSFALLYRHPTYCALKANKDINKTSRFKKIIMFFLVSEISILFI